MKLYPYKMGSGSARNLANALGIKLVKHEGKMLKTDILINWGASNIKRNIEADVILNPPDSVKNASNKLKTFRLLEEAGVSVPCFTINKDDAQVWLDDGACDVVVRHKLTGHSGEGIEIIKDQGPLPDAPLYVVYVPKKDEYRIHVFMGEVIFVQRKARNKAIKDEDVNWKVRNHANGFIFAHKDVVAPADALSNAVNAVNALDLHFGAVDVIIDSYAKEAVVLEVNTACGMEGETLNKYVAAFSKEYHTWLGERQ